MPSIICNQSYLAKRRNWEVGQRASTKLVKWCQDQWRRKDPCLPQSLAAYFENEPSTIPWFHNIPVCHQCGVPCPSCRNELASKLPSEMSTAWAILSFHAIHENNQNLSDDKDDDEDENENDGSASKEPEERATSPQIRMQLRSRKR